MSMREGVKKCEKIFTYYIGGIFFQNQLKKPFRSERIGHTGLKKFFARAGKTGLPGTQPVKGENFFRKLLKK